MRIGVILCRTATQMSLHSNIHKRVAVEFFSVYFTTNLSTSRAVTNGISMPLLTGLICDRLIELFVLIYLKPEAPHTVNEVDLNHNFSGHLSIPHLRQAP